ncbi:MAG: Na+/H+ antiporter subunit E [Eubacteriales bacterium]|nr:Na+/H+ antiporter subunit E [Eubacteriales bacterium]
MYLLFFALWVIFNGAFTLEICILGLIVAAVIFWFTCRYMDYSVEKEKRLYRKIPEMIRYVFVLVKEIVKANYMVIRMILTEKEEPEPVIVSFQAPVKTVPGRAFLANAITLTPGTITVTLENNEYTVHCLDESYAEGMDQSVFVELLQNLER